MIISRTPFRISFFGGGTDYPQWYLENGGSVLATTINKYCYISCRKLPPFFEYKHRIVYSKIENVKSVNEIIHPSVRATLEWSKINHGLEIHHDGDLPARSGLGSSSSFTVGLITALRALNGEMMSQYELARSALHIEQKVIKENVGSQDQICAAYGGFNRINFLRSGEFTVNPIIVAPQRINELKSNLMLFFTGFTRYADEIAKSQIQNIKNRVKELNHMNSMVDEAIAILSSPITTIDEFGKLLDDGWQYKKRMSDQITNENIDRIYDKAIKAGAIGGKLLGAGGGGFMLFYVTPKYRYKLKQSLQDLVHVDFDFENTGSKVVVYYPNGL